MGTRKPAEMPSQVSSEVGYFDRFAGWAARLASRAPFFAFCLLLVVIWPQLPQIAHAEDDTQVRSATP